MASSPDSQRQPSQEARVEAAVAAPEVGATPFAALGGIPSGDLAGRLARLDPAARASMVARLQSGRGNRYVQQLARQDHGTQQQAAPPPGAGTSPARPDLSGLRTLADSYINSQYASAARDGLADAENVLGNQFDYGSFLTALAGNLIWAAACFSTGGTAFIISLAGIGVGAAAPDASTTVDRATFHTDATRMIDGIVTHLLNQIDRVTRDVDAVAAERGLSDADTRRELLQRLVRPEYIQTVQGGLPVVNRGAIAHRIQTDLLIKANAAPGGLLRGYGRFQYDYTVTNFMTEHGVWPFDSQSLNPVSGWVFTRGPSSAYIPQGEQAALDVLKREPLLQPATMPWGKSLYLSTDDRLNALEIHLDANNAISSVNVYGVFEQLGAAPFSGPSRSAPPPPDRDGGARQVLAGAWAGTGGQPPWIRGQDLMGSIFPYRSRATR